MIFWGSGLVGVGLGPEDRIGSRPTKSEAGMSLMLRE